jgi:hypothetical protein
LEDTGMGVFRGCTNIKSVYFNAVEFRNSNHLFSFSFDHKSIESFHFGNDVKYIPNGICVNSHFSDINIPNGVKRIGAHAFSCCHKLKSISIPNGVESIHDCAFEACTSLTSISFPNNLHCLGSGVLEDCHALSSVILPDSISYIPSKMFKRCFDLKTIIIPDNVKGIYDEAFQDCYSLISITLSNDVEEIGPYVFNGCYKLKFRGVGSSVVRLLVCAIRFPRCQWQTLQILWRQNGL